MKFGSHSINLSRISKCENNIAFSKSLEKQKLYTGVKVLIDTTILGEQLWKNFKVQKDEIRCHLYKNVKYGNFNGYMSLWLKNKYTNGYTPTCIAGAASGDEGKEMGIGSETKGPQQYP